MSVVPSEGAYTYQGTQYGVTHATLTLNHAQVNSGHVAVWLGAGHTNKSWIQAGIQQTYGQQQPHLYVEVGHQNGARKLVSLGPYKWGHPVAVKLQNVDGVWSVVVNGKPYGRIYLGQDTAVLATSESYHAGQPNKYKYTVVRKK